ncbi:myotubularin-like protein [Achlya hypogyna]|uniref:phosphatidylinositol-3,5-bisphosphate 3-phosphatase n=1 Tax=Achlya hypogyna TaxID=1202772 RepID=A0A1V9ZFU5_ACHHY|nr:myotubularin-like protein [Achlya hypogyna]
MSSSPAESPPPPKSLQVVIPVIPTDDRRSSPERTSVAAGRESPAESIRQGILNEVSRITQKSVAWVPDSLADKCYQCTATFSLVLRRHHCRRCGNIFCDACSLSRMPLVSAGFFTPVRVCDKCCEAAKRSHRHMVNERRRMSLTQSLPHSSLTTMHADLHHHLPLDDDDAHSVISASASPMTASLADAVCIQTIPGEVVVVRGTDVQLRTPDFKDNELGTLYITNYRVVFTSLRKAHEAATPLRRRSSKTGLGIHNAPMLAPPLYHAIPLRTIDRIKRQELPESDTGVLDLVCKDIRRLQLIFPGLVQRQTFSFFDKCDQLLRHPMPYFAKVCTETFPTATIGDGWNVYDPVAEFNRLGVGVTATWRITNVNHDYAFCPTYSAAIAVPAAVSDAELLVAGAFRSKARIPALSWRDVQTGATICRSSQPLVGLGQKQCAEDIALVQAIAAANPSSSTLVIVDARPWANAVAQKTVGRAGYELTAHYEHKPPSSDEDDTDDAVATLHLGLTDCRLVFMGIENIHIMRKSFQKLVDLCMAKDQRPGSTSKWNEHVAATKWLDHISCILHAAVEIVRLVKAEKASVLVHCSDGWDRTSQLTALAELMLDPYYRTLRGFALLVEKDWCSFGHKFSERTGHPPPTDVPNASEISVVFLQWIECVWQLIRQFPCSFEFNSRYLILVLDHLYSCRFGTFLYDSEMGRVAEERAAPTVSLWTYLSSLEVSLISNPFYEPRKYSRQNWHARMKERRQANEVPVPAWSDAAEGVVGLEDKDDGVVLVHTPQRVAPSPAPTPPPASAVGKTKLVHSIVQDLDTGLMFPHVSEEMVVPPRPPRHLREALAASFVGTTDETAKEPCVDAVDDTDVLIPSVSVKSLRLWTEYYLRWDATCSIERNADLEREAKLRDVLTEAEQDTAADRPTSGWTPPVDVAEALRAQEERLRRDMDRMCMAYEDCLARLLCR